MWKDVFARRRRDEKPDEEGLSQPDNVKSPRINLNINKINSRSAHSKVIKPLLLRVADALISVCECSDVFVCVFVCNSSSAREASKQH